MTMQIQAADGLNRKGGVSPLPFAPLLQPPDGRDVCKNALILSDSNIVRIFLNEDVFIVIAQPDQEIMLAQQHRISVAKQIPSRRCTTVNYSLKK